jgi:hypothetical protein
MRVVTLPAASGLAALAAAAGAPAPPLAAARVTAVLPRPEVIAT